MSKQVKEMMIHDIRAELGSRKDFVVLDVSKLDAISTGKLRTELRGKGITLLGVKNTLARLAFKQAGIDIGKKLLNGPTTLAWGGEDIVGLSREMADWAKKIDKIEIRGGVVDGTAVDAGGVESISKGPSRLELIGQIAGLILSPGAMLAGALLGPGGKLSGQVKAISEKESGSEKETGGDAA